MAKKTSIKSKKAAAKRGAAKAAKPRKTAPKSKVRKATLLAGGNPQIAKAGDDGERMCVGNREVRVWHERRLGHRRIG
jgi:hypothetical protein